MTTVKPVTKCTMFSSKPCKCPLCTETLDEVRRTLSQPMPEDVRVELLVASMNR